MIDGARHNDPEIRAVSETDPRIAHFWNLPTDQAFLAEFLTYVFLNYWDQIVFGPVLDGGVYELTCPAAPTVCRVDDGYLKVSFGGPHFHLCVGDPLGNPEAPTPEPLRRLRRPAKAYLFRRLNEVGQPLWWGFEVLNGAGQATLRIFFASPFLENADFLPESPRWGKLAMWRDISKRFLGLEPDAFDETGTGQISPPPVQ